MVYERMADRQFSLSILRMKTVLARIAVRCAWMISAAALVIFYLYPVETYCEDFGMIVTRAEFQDIALCVFGSVLLLQAVYPPRRDALFRIALNLLPVGVLLTLVVMSMSRWGMAAVAVYAALQLSELRGIRRVRRRSMRMHMMRSLVLFTCMTFCGSGLPGGVLYLSRAARLGRQNGALLVHAEIERQDPIGAKDAAVRILSDDWFELGMEERLELLRAVMQEEAKHLGAGELTLEAAQLGEKHGYGVANAHFDPARMTIVINDNRLMERNGEDALTSLLHECRHAYQYRVVGMIDWSSREALEHPFYSEARAWRSDFDGAGGYGESIRTEYEFYDHYYYSEIEIDARDYAQDRFYDYYALTYSE
ncbi:MAG: hypothetical protein J6K32_10760 [Clostridia bacterium]|nr:hypothetical protein [Clostridia bacterium]